MAKLRMAHAGTHGARRHAWRSQAAWAKIQINKEDTNIPRQQFSSRMNYNLFLQEMSMNCDCRITHLIKIVNEGNK